MKILLKLIPIVIIIYLGACQNGVAPGIANTRNEIFNENWEFIKDHNLSVDSSIFSKENKLNWEKVDLPHSAQIEPLVIKGNQWQGICYYRKFFKLDESDKGKHVAIKFDGAMQVAEVYLNGRKLKTNYGGYLPFYVDISKSASFETENCLLVKLDNKDNAHVPPGKPVANLDFNIYSGIYRDVWLQIKDKLHVTDPFEVDKIAGGGVFVRFSDVNNDSAKINLKIDVINESERPAAASVEAVLLDKEGAELSRSKSDLPINQHRSGIFNISFEVKSPKLWSPESPYLYTIQLSLSKDGKLVGQESHRIGIRTISFSADQGFLINRKKLKIRGTNRHQEYPYVGYAISNNANYRDAYKIKQAGFNFVRLSHYPHSESFINACDELGILVQDAIPGWQFFGDSLFQENSISDVRKMVRRDRNHPSVIAWEVSLNESGMTKEFMLKAHNATHQEYPGNNVYTSGWIDDVYDIYIPARQHAKPPYYWNKYDKNKPIIIAEYGDWEYYAQNAGFNQKAYKDLSEQERNSRQFRGCGQKRLLQQALNYQESHNDNLNGKAIGDANWLMFDYNRGYAPDIEASGIMDIFRLPKFAYYFYQSQADVIEKQPSIFNKPMIFIANYYNDPSFLEVKVYSNCDEVELKLDGKTIEKRKPDNDIYATNLLHPPFTFKLKNFVSGELTATGYIKGKQVLTISQKTPENAAGLKLWIDESGKPLGKNDMVFLYAAITDTKGTIVPDAISRVKFSVEGDAELIGTNPIDTEAGIAAILLKAGKKGGDIKIIASCDGLKTAELKLSIK